MKRRMWFVPIGLVAALGLAAPAAAAAPAKVQAACSVTWGSAPKSAGTMTTAPIVNVRGGQQECYDRLVIDVAGSAAGYDVRYVDQVRMDGSGQVVPLRGGAKIQVVALAPAYDEDGNSTYNPANRRELVNVTGWQTFRQVAWAGTFEGQTTIGLGVRARLPFRAFTLAGPGTATRVVVDVAHQW